MIGTRAGLFQAGDPAAIDAAGARSPVGKLLPDDLAERIRMRPLPTGPSHKSPKTRKRKN
jgi:hypothetical protein